MDAWKSLSLFLLCIVVCCHGGLLRSSSVEIKPLLTQNVQASRHDLIETLPTRPPISMSTLDTKSLSSSPKFVSDESSNAQTTTIILSVLLQKHGENHYHHEQQQQQQQPERQMSKQSSDQILNDDNDDNDDDDNDDDDNNDEGNDGSYESFAEHWDKTHVGSSDSDKKKDLMKAINGIFDTFSKYGHITVLEVENKTGTEELTPHSDNTEADFLKIAPDTKTAKLHSAPNSHNTQSDSNTMQVTAEYFKAMPTQRIVKKITRNVDYPHQTQQHPASFRRENHDTHQNIFPGPVHPHDEESHPAPSSSSLKLLENMGKEKLLQFIYFVKQITQTHSSGGKQTTITIKQIGIQFEVFSDLPNFSDLCCPW